MSANKKELNLAKILNQPSTESFEDSDEDDKNDASSTSETSDADYFGGVNLGSSQMQPSPRPTSESSLVMPDVTHAKPPPAATLKTKVFHPQKVLGAEAPKAQASFTRSIRRISRIHGLLKRLPASGRRASTSIIEAPPSPVNSCERSHSQEREQYIRNPYFNDNENEHAFEASSLSDIVNATPRAESVSDKLSQITSRTNSTRPPHIKQAEYILESLTDAIGEARNTQILGIDHYTGIFAFDQLLQTFLFATVQGDINLVTPDYEILLRNPIKSVLLSHIVVIPGTGRFITIGRRHVQPLRDRHLGHDLSEEGQQLLDVDRVTYLQVWNFASTPIKPIVISKMGGESTTATAPVAIELPFGVACINRVRHSRTQLPETLLRNCVANAQKTDTSNTISLSSTISTVVTPQNAGWQQEPSPRTPAELQKMGSLKVAQQQQNSSLSSLTPQQRLAATAQFFSHPDNTPFPFGSPIDDSRWLFLIGTTEGDTKIFDSWTCEFMDYVIRPEIICKQLISGIPPNGLPDNVLRLFKLTKLENLPTVKSISPHPTLPSSILISYENAINILWDFSTHKITRCYLPFSSQALRSVDVSGSDSPTLIYKKSMDKAHYFCEGKEHTVLIPHNNNMLTATSCGIPFLHALQWHPSGTAFCAAISCLTTETNAEAFLTRRGYSPTLPSGLMLLVYSIFSSIPVVCISLDFLLQQPLHDWHIPYMYWEQARHSTHATSTNASPMSLNIPALMQGYLYILLTPATPEASQNMKMYIETIAAAKRSFGFTGTYSTSQPIAPPSQHRRRGSSEGAPNISYLANIYRLGGHLWSSVQPMLPNGLARPGSLFSFHNVLMVQPSPHQGPTKNYPVTSALAGLRFPQGTETDQSEDAETVVAAANKLGKYLAASSYLIVLIDNPTRQVLACCCKVDKQKHKLVCFLHPNLIPSLNEEQKSNHSPPRYESSLLQRNSTDWLLNNNNNNNSITNSKGFQAQSRDGIPTINRRQSDKNNNTRNNNNHHRHRGIVGKKDNNNDDDDNDDNNEDNDFSPWSTMPRSIPFQIDWQTLTLSGITTTLWISKSNAGTAGLSFYSFSEDNMQKTGTDAAFTRSFRTSSNETLDYFVDALFTLRRKHCVHAWLYGLLGKPSKMFVSTILKQGASLEDAQRELKILVSGTRKELLSYDPNNTNQLPLGAAALNSDEENDDDAQFDEWQKLNETKFFGDLLRVSECHWGLETRRANTYKGITVTGHLDGKIRIWLSTHGGLILLHTLSIVNSLSLFPYATKSYVPLEKITPFSTTTFEHTDCGNDQIISQVDCCPVIKHVPDNPAITAVALYMTPIEAYMQDPYPSSGGGGSAKNLEITRYLAAGCMTGEIVIYQWRSTSHSLAPLEAKCLMKDKSLTSANINKTTDSMQEVSSEDIKYYEELAHQWISMLPCGFNCIARHTSKNASRITMLYIISISVFDETPLQTPTSSQQQHQTKKDNTIRIIPKRLLKKKWLSSSSVSSPSMATSISTDESKLLDESFATGAANIYRLISGDAQGIVYVYELPVGNLLASLPPLNKSVDVVSSNPPASSCPRNAATAVVMASVISRPLISGVLSTKQQPILVSSTQPSAFDQLRKSRYMAVGYSNGIIRILDCLSAKFLDDTANSTTSGVNETRFITRLDVLGILSRQQTMPKNTTGRRTTREGGLTIPGDAASTLTDQNINLPAVKILLLEELPAFDILQLVLVPVEDAVSTVCWVNHDLEKLSKQQQQQQPVTTTSSCIALATTKWAGVIECRCISDPAIGNAFIPHSVIGMELETEIQASTCTFVKNVPTLVSKKIAQRFLIEVSVISYQILLSKTGTVQFYYIAATNDLELYFRLYPQKITNIVANTIPGNNLTTLTKDGFVFSGCRVPDSGASLYQLSTVARGMEDHMARWKFEAKQQLRDMCNRHIQYANIDSTIRTTSTRSSMPNKTTLLSPAVAPQLQSHGLTSKRSRSSSGSKGWKSMLFGKINTWVGAGPEHLSKSATSKVGTLRHYIRTAPEDCRLSSVQGRRLQPDTASSGILRPRRRAEKSEYTPTALRRSSLPYIKRPDHDNNPYH